MPNENVETIPIVRDTCSLHDCQLFVTSYSWFSLPQEQVTHLSVHP